MYFIWLLWAWLIARQILIYLANWWYYLPYYDLARSGHNLRASYLRIWRGFYHFTLVIDPDFGCFLIDIFHLCGVLGTIVLLYMFKNWLLFVLILVRDLLVTAATIKRPKCYAGFRYVLIVFSNLFPWTCLKALECSLTPTMCCNTVSMNFLFVYLIKRILCALNPIICFQLFQSSIMMLAWSYP